MLRMPKQTPSIPNETLWAHLGDRSALSDELWLIAAQVGMLLGRSTDQLAEDRKVGNPPPFKKDGGSIRYRLGSVRDHMFNTQEFKTTTEAKIAANKLPLGTFASLWEWADNAQPDDLRLFYVRRGERPIDFWQSLLLGDELSDNDRCEWIRADDYRNLCDDQFLSRNLEDQVASIDSETFGMRVEFAKFLDDVAELRLEQISPSRIAEAPFDKITDAIHLHWIRQILNKADEQHSFTGFVSMVTLREAYAAKVDAWTIPMGIEMLLNVSKGPRQADGASGNQEISFFIRQATEAAFSGTLPFTVSRYGDIVIKPKDYLAWARDNNLPIDLKVEEAIESQILGSISPKKKPGRPNDPELRMRGRDWRRAAYQIIKNSVKRVTFIEAARQIANNKTLALGYEMETIRKQITAELMRADGYDLKK